MNMQIKGNCIFRCPRLLTGKYIINSDTREEGRGKNMKKKQKFFPSSPTIIL